MTINLYRFLYTFENKINACSSQRKIFYFPIIIMDVSQ